MSKFNLLVFLSTYGDTAASNNPSLSNFKWTREIAGVPAENPTSESFSLAPGESKSLFSGTRTLGSDITTDWDIELKTLTSNTYILTATGGSLPNFRTPRSIGTDATSQVTVTRNATLAIFTFSGGTLPNLATVVVGDYIRIGTQFNDLSEGEFKILAKTATSITIENDLASSEGPITLGASFAEQIAIYSSAGVQVGDTLVISGGFSSVSQRSYQITAVAANYLEFYSTSVLPAETSINTTGINIYSAAKSLIYLESDQKVAITVNGSVATSIEPFIVNDTVSPGVFMLKSTVYSLSVQNDSNDTASLFSATIE